MGMSRVSKNLGFTVPPTMADEFEQMAKQEQSTKSELFRRVFRFYQASRNSRATPSNDFDAWVERAIFDAVEEQRTTPVSEEKLRALDKKLLRYGAERAAAVGIDVEDEDAINRLIYADRHAQRAKA